MHPEITLTTPALLFPAISLLLLAYTNRFLVIAQLIRQLHGNNRTAVQDMAIRQISSLRKRIKLIKLMQALGVVSFILCTISMFFLFYELQEFGAVAFALSLFALTFSLVVSLYEILISTHAIELELQDLSPQTPSK